MGLIVGSFSLKSILQYEILSCPIGRQLHRKIARLCCVCRGCTRSLQHRSRKERRVSRLNDNLSLIAASYRKCLRRPRERGSHWSGRSTGSSCLLPVLPKLCKMIQIHLFQCGSGFLRIQPGLVEKRIRIIPVVEIKCFFFSLLSDETHHAIIILGRPDSCFGHFLFQHGINFPETERASYHLATVRQLTKMENA
jgi:hypothetical protein